VTNQLFVPLCTLAGFKMIFICDTFFEPGVLPGEGADIKNQ
jgi:hypothetical protein